MEAEASRFGWHWVVAVLTPPPENQLPLLDPAKAKIRKNVTIGNDALINNLLLWVDRQAFPNSSDPQSEAQG